MIDWTAITAVIGSIATVVGSYGGYLLAGRNEERRDQRADARETVARRAALADQLEEERHTFQRDTMLELQDQLLLLTRAYVLWMMRDEQRFGASHVPEKLPSDLDGDRPRELIAAIHRLRTRILDPELRDAINDLVMLCSRDAYDLQGAEPAKAIAELRARERAANQAYLALVEQLGKHLRMELDRHVPAANLTTNEKP